MSGGFYDELARVWQDSKIDGLGMLNPQELVEESMKMDSRGLESVGKKWNLPWLQEEAHGNVQNPAKGIGKASTMAAASMAGGWLGNLANAGNAAGTAGTMESALMNTGYTPSTFANLMQYGQGSGNFGQAAMNYGGSLLGGNGNEAARRFAMRQGMDMMQPQQPMQAPQQRYQQPQDPMVNPYQQLTEEEKQKLRELGYTIPY